MRSASHGWDGRSKFSRAKFERPSHPWEAERIKAENELLKKYGLKNKKELWRSQYVLRRLRPRAPGPQGAVRGGAQKAGEEGGQLPPGAGRAGGFAPGGERAHDALAADAQADQSRR